MKTISLANIEMIAIAKRFLGNLIREFFDKGCQKSAAALTYMTLFALVPMMTVTYTMFSVFPMFDGMAEQLQSLIFDSFVPETGHEVQGYLADFSSQARSLTGFGVGMLVVTAFLMLMNIERTFNAIWGVQQARRGLSSFLLYWAVLSIGPVLLAAGLLMTTYLVSMKFVVDEINTIGVIAPLLRLIPLLMTSAAFTLLFAAVPNCKVPFKLAVIGGFVTAMLFELLKFGFGGMVANSSFQLIYGAFAVVPLFLLWVNILWTVILAGAVFVRALSEHKYAESGDLYSDMLAILKCLALFRRYAKTGLQLSDKDCIDVGISVVHWQKLRALLIDGQWIAVTQAGDYVLCRDLRQVCVWDIAILCGMRVDEQYRTPTQKYQKKRVSKTLRAQSSGGEAPGAVSPAEAVSPLWFTHILDAQKTINTHAKSQLGENLEALYALDD